MKTKYNFNIKELTEYDNKDEFSAFLELFGNDFSKLESSIIDMFNQLTQGNHSDVFIEELPHPSAKIVNKALWDVKSIMSDYIAELVYIIIDLHKSKIAMQQQACEELQDLKNTLSQSKSDIEFGYKKNENFDLTK